MSLTLTETFRVAAHPDRVWAFLKNPADVVTCLPGAELTGTIDASTYAGRVKVKVGPITAAYAGTATLRDVDDAARRMTIVAEGKESGGPGSARMTLTGAVVALDDGASEVRVDAAIDIAGRVMQFGRGLIESVNKQLFRQFADAVQVRLASAEAAAAVAAEPAVHAPSIPDEMAPVPSPAVQPATASPATAGAPAIASGGELRALPLLWKALAGWLRGIFGGR